MGQSRGDLVNIVLDRVVGGEERDDFRPGASGFEATGPELGLIRHSALVGRRRKILRKNPR